MLKVQVTLVSLQVRRKVVVVDVNTLSRVEKAALKPTALLQSEGMAVTLEPWRVANIEVMGAIEDLSVGTKPKWETGGFPDTA